MCHKVFIYIFILICYVTLSSEYKIGFIKSDLDDTKLIDITKKHIEYANSINQFGTRIVYDEYTDSELENVLKTSNSPTAFVCNCAPEKMDHYLEIVNNTNKMIWCLTPYAPYRCNHAFLPGVSPNSAVLYSII